MTYGGIIANAGTSGPRFTLEVGGESYAGRTDLKVGPVRVSLQGPGGVSQASFSVTQSAAGYTRIAPFWGGKDVQIRDTQLDSGLRFLGMVTNTRSRRLIRSQRVIEVTAAGRDWFLDHRIIPVFKTRTDTTGRTRKFNNDSAIVKAILEKANLHEMAAGGRIDTTNSAMDDMHFKGQTVRECLDEIAELAQPLSNYQVRRYYVDGNGQLHYYKNTENLPAPCLIGDDLYLTSILGKPNLVSFWSGRVSSGTVIDHMGYADMGFSGAPLTGLPSLCYSHPELPAFRLDGVADVGLPTGNNLHPGDTFSIGFVFKRGATGSAQTVWSGGSNDVQIGFDATDHIQVVKEGVGDAFVSTTAYTSTLYTYHLVVTHSAANGTKVYVNGAAIAGTETSRTFVAGTGTVNIGRKKSTSTTYYNGRLWGIFVSSAEFSASTVSALYDDWRTMVPDELSVERDSSDVTKKVYIKGAPGGEVKSSGYVTSPTILDPNFEPIFFDPLPEEFLDRPDSTTQTKRDKYGNSYMSAKAGTTVSVQFTATYDPSNIVIETLQQSFRPGQLLTVSSDADNLDGFQTEIRQVDVDLNLGNGVQTFQVSCGSVQANALRKFKSLMRADLR